MTTNDERLSAPKVTLDVRFQLSRHQMDHSAVREYFAEPRLSVAAELNESVTVRFQPNCARPTTLRWTLGNRKVWHVEPAGATLPGEQAAWDDWQTQADMALWNHQQELPGLSKRGSVVAALLTGEVLGFANWGNTIMRFTHDPLPKETPEPDGYVTAIVSDYWGGTTLFDFEPLDGDEELVSFHWKEAEQQWLTEPTYEPFPAGEHPDLIRYAEQELQRIRAAERLADVWNDAYLLLLISLHQDGVTIEHKRQAPGRED